MRRPFSKDFSCASCGRTYNLIVEYDDRNSPIPCRTEGCDGAAGPIFGVPRPLRASYHDGVRRPGLREEVEACELESKAYELPVEKRGELLSEAAKLRASEVKK